MSEFDPIPPSLPPEAPAPEAAADPTSETPQPKPARLEPTRYGDWELNGKCVDF